MKTITEFLVNNHVKLANERHSTAKSWEDIAKDEERYFKINTHVFGSKTNILMGISAAKMNKDKDTIHYKVGISKGLEAEAYGAFANHMNNEWMELTEKDIELLNELEDICKTNPEFDGYVTGDSNTGWKYKEH